MRTFYLAPLAFALIAWNGCAATQSQADADTELVFLEDEPLCTFETLKEDSAPFEDSWMSLEEVAQRPSFRRAVHRNARGLEANAVVMERLLRVVVQGQPRSGSSRGRVRLTFIHADPACLAGM